MRPSDEKIALFKEDYDEHIEALPERTGDRIISYENTCVVYDYVFDVLHSYDWDNGMPNVKDITQGRNNYKFYFIPVYTCTDNESYELTEFIEYSDYGRGIEGWDIQRRENVYRYWSVYPVELTFHTMAFYACEDVKRIQSGKITGMALFGAHCGYGLYCVIDTDKGSYMYAFPYDEEQYISMIFVRAYRGKTDTEEFKELYLYREENVPDGSGVILGPDVPNCIFNMESMGIVETRAFRKAFDDYRMALETETRRLARDGFGALYLQRNGNG